MSIGKKILKAIYVVIIIIELILLVIFSINHSLPEYMKDYEVFFKNLFISVSVIFVIAIVCYIIEHKMYNKNEKILDENLIEPKFDIDFKDKDILYLSTILNQKLPGKKEIILLIMQLINKKVIDLSSYYDGNEYQYIITNRLNDKIKINNVENSLLNYLFEKSESVNLIDKVRQIYSSKNKEVSNIEKSIYNFSEVNRLIKHSKISLVYKILAVISAILILFSGICILLPTGIAFEFKGISQIISTFFGIGLICICIAFIYIIILKRLNYIYQYNNDTISWILLNIIFLNLCLIVSYIFPFSLIVQFLTYAIYIFASFAVMIKYNTHISLSENDVNVRNRLISLKNYFKSMNYLTDKELANIITYEECMMYGFLFNITIKINNEFDLLQKELLNAMKQEGMSYLNILKTKI